jgi:hypothetical protein
MAKIFKMVDDLDGVTDAEMTLQFGLDGETYEIDLGDENYEKYRSILELLASSGRKVERPIAMKRGTQARKSLGNKPAGGNTAEIREFLRGLGHPVSDRGRISADLMKLWESREVITESSVKAPEKPVQTVKSVTAAEVQDKVDALPEDDEDTKAEQAVIARVKNVKPKRGSQKTAVKPEFSELREVLSLEEGK